MKKHFVAIVSATMLIGPGCSGRTIESPVSGPTDPLAASVTIIEPDSSVASAEDGEESADAGPIRPAALGNSGCAGVESAKWGGKYSCKGFLNVKARNTCNRKIAIEICIQKWVGSARKMDCGLSNVGSARTMSYWTCDATGHYTIRAREPW